MHHNVDRPESRSTRPASENLANPSLGAVPEHRFTHLAAGSDPETGHVILV
jgi:hypothetical protein